MHVMRDVHKKPDFLDMTGVRVYKTLKSYTGARPRASRHPPVINDDGLSDTDPLVKMAVIHHQFESIHPFYDGNGRTGRIINILYLVAKGLLNIPVLYLSRYVIRTKSEYYRLLQQTRDTGNWEPWILYMLQGVELTARQTIWIIGRIKALMMDYKHRIRAELPKIYSQDLLNNLFRHPYTKIEALQNDLQVSRLTATKYLDRLTDEGFAEKHKIGRYNYYINFPLMRIFTEIPDQPEAFDAPAMDSE
jgi:Fic family protein